MSNDLGTEAVMNIDKGGESIGMWATQQVPGMGVYRRVARKRSEGIIELAHFIHRADGKGY